MKPAATAGGDRAPPLRNGVAASCVTLPAGPWPTALAFLAGHFPRIDEATWRARLRAGLVTDENGVALAEDAAYRAGARLYYYRELPEEPVTAGEESVLFHDQHLLVVDKPHFLAVMPGGRYARETLLARLRRRLGIDDLAPLHRLDRATAGVVAFSTHGASRDAYLALWRSGQVDKTYEALAGPLPDVAFPVVRRSRIVAGEPFFRMREVEGEPNSETRIDVVQRGASAWRYRLEPRTGKKHQLRIHLAALGAGILNDPFYPHLQADPAEDARRPLQLLARELAFADPLTGMRRVFRSARELGWPDAVADR